MLLVNLRHTVMSSKFFIQFVSRFSIDNNVQHVDLIIRVMMTF